MKKGLIVHAVVMNDRQELLLLRRSATEDVYPGAWDIPGGTLQDGENPKDGVIREIKEETGLNVEGLSVFHFTSNVDESKDTQFVRLIFVGKYTKGEIRLDPNDHDAYGWVPIDSPLPTDIDILDFVSESVDILKNRR